MVYFVEDCVGIATPIAFNSLAGGCVPRLENSLAERLFSDLHSCTQGLKNNFHEALDEYRNSRILTNGSRLSQKLRADQGIHSRVSGGSSA